MKYRWRHKLAALLLCLILLPVAASAHDGIVVGLQLEPPNLDPTSGAASAIDDVTYGTIFEELVRLDAQGAVKPWLATRWSISADRLLYVFTLRPDVRFQNGTPFTADDVVFSLRRAIAPGSTNAQAQALSAIADVRALDALTVQVRLKTPDADFLRLLSYGDAAIVSPRSAAKLAIAPIGTGPFRLSDWRRGDAITLVRNPLYWGAPPHVPQVTFRFIADPTAAYAAIQAHDVDVFPDFPAPETLDQLRADPTLKLAIGPTEGQVILALNQRTGPLADLRVRRAIAMALDRRAIIDGAMAGYGVPIGSHFAPQDPDYVDLTARYPHDPAGARRLLAQAGYGSGLSLTLILPPPPYARRSGEIIAAQLAAVGIHARIANVEWAQWLDQVFLHHAFDMTVINHAEPYDYDIYGRDDYYFGYHSAVVRALLADLKASDDPARRHALLGALQRRLADDAVNGFLFEFPRLGVQDARLADLWVNTPNQGIDLATVHFAGGDAGREEAQPQGDGGTSRWGYRLALSILGLAAVAGSLLGGRRIATRAIALAATLLAATILIFALVQIAPGDPAAAMMGLQASPRAIATLRTELGLDGSVFARYVAWLTGLLRGDFGTSYTYRVPVSGLLAERIGVSLPLALLATLVSILLGVPAGYAAVRWRKTWPDRVVGWLARIGVALPSFWLGILLVLLFSSRLHLLPAGGFPGWQAGPGPALAALTLPIIALALPQAAILARVTRAALLDAAQDDYVRTARAKGLSVGAALRRHALPNAIGPVLTVLGLQLPYLFAGSAIVETVFFLPGLGRLLLQAIAQRDLIVVQSVVVVIVAATVAASFLVDLLQAAIDPRLRGRDEA